MGQLFMSLIVASIMIIWSTETGKVIEFHDADIEKIQERIAKQNGYDLVGHSLVLYVKPKS